jgi:hypothetical protein
MLSGDEPTVTRNGLDAADRAFKILYQINDLSFVEHLFTFSQNARVKYHINRMAR